MKVVVKDMLVVKKYFGKDAKCNVEVVKNEETNKYEVILSKPEVDNYMGRSVTNYFEEFSTAVKKKYLSSIPSEDIRWFDFMQWEAKSFEDLKILVSMEWNNKKFTSAKWIGEVA